MFNGYGGYGYQLPKYEILRVNGRGGIDALQMAPTCEVLALDTSAPLIWLIQTDGAGYKTPMPFRVSPYAPEPEKNPLEERIEAIEKRLEAISGEQPDSVHAGPRRRRQAEQPIEQLAE